MLASEPRDEADKLRNTLLYSFFRILQAKDCKSAKVRAEICHGARDLSDLCIFWDCLEGNCDCST